MKDFTQAAEELYPDLLYVPSNEQPYYNRHQNRELEQVAFMAGASHGYSEVMKEHREFYLIVREYFAERELRYFDGVHMSNAHKLEEKIKKALAAFTEHEQSELPL